MKSKTEAIELIWSWSNKDCSWW